MEIAVRKRRIVARRSGAALAKKVAIAAALCLCVRMIVAQAPPADVPAPEQVDAQGYKYQVPLDKYRKSPTDQTKARTFARNVLAGQSIADPAQRQLFREFFLKYVFPVMTTEEGLRTIGKDRQDFLRRS